MDASVPPTRQGYLQPGEGSAAIRWYACRGTAVLLNLPVLLVLAACAVASLGAVVVTWGEVPLLFPAAACALAALCGLILVGYGLSIARPPAIGVAADGIHVRAEPFIRGVARIDRNDLSFVNPLMRFQSVGSNRAMLVIGLPRPTVEIRFTKEIEIGPCRPFWGAFFSPGPQRWGKAGQILPARSRRFLALAISPVDLSELLAALAGTLDLQSIREPPSPLRWPWAKRAGPPMG